MVDMPTDQSSFWRKNWKLVVNIATFTALAILVVSIRHQIGQTLTDLGRVNVWALVLMVVFQSLNYLAQTKTYKGLFAVLGINFSLKTLLKFSLEMNFVNHVFPSGGAAGLSYFGVRFRQEGVSVAKSTLIQLMKLVLLFLSFEVLLIIGLFILAASGKANNLVILLAGVITTVLLFATVGFVYMLAKKERVNKTFVFVSRTANKFIHLFNRKNPETIRIDGIKGLVDELSENHSLFIKHWRELRAPFWWALAANATEIMTIYVVYLAFGEWVNYGALVLAYAIANFAGLVSILPGGVGIYEGLMTLVLATAGVSAAISLPVTIMYRVLNTAIQLPPGYYFYHRNLRKASKRKATSDVG